MRLALISDVHGQWAEFNYPEADVLIIAGDILHNYSYNREADAGQQLFELAKLNSFLGSLTEYRWKIVVAGNHDFAFQKRNLEARALLHNAIYLEDEGIVLDGVKFYGSPWQPHFYEWAYNFPPSSKWGGNDFKAADAAKSCWSKIPDDTNVLITHGPPFDILDETVRGEKVGCPFLAKRIGELKQLKLSCFGHIHSSFGMKKIGDTIFANVAGLHEDYKTKNPVTVVEV